MIFSSSVFLLPIKRWGAISSIIRHYANRVKPSYPDDDIDMIYFYPPLALTNGKGIAQLSPITLDGKQYQQWSRHRTKENPWRPGLDSVCTHLLQADSWLERELRK